MSRMLHTFMLIFCAKLSMATPLDTQKIQDAIDYIHLFYVEDNIQDNFTDQALTGILSYLDPHSQYLTNEQADALKTITQGDFVGVGLSLSLQNQKLIVTNILPNTPAEKSNLKVHDVITHIDQTPIDPNNLLNNIKKMRGPSNSWVTLTRQTAPFNIRLQRKTIDIPEVNIENLPENITRIHISLFNEDTTDDLIKALYNNQDADAYLIDLRNNPGGLLGAAINATMLFLNYDTVPDATITQLIGKHSTMPFQLPPEATDITQNKPLFILLNQNSASGAEIFASALQYYKRATILGETSQGKGTVQSLIPLGDGSMLKLTTAYFTRPNGDPINNIGIIPDFTINPMTKTPLSKALSFIRKSLSSTETFHAK
ncbi:S41 family peptidase [Candidatus Synchoanobacter obligatus]|uniref:S41 family peptidase n=1 Tax=Candidatus Synchoanobacter obligatus TaxID=2919597 RepID=A0ABT1L799_9GAMM|nr:S41 family peptidase [Candidatus Synchoanobacter obligatus]MCP8352623.1 S41 family peptidase [Candidatus Synchoanobacter obligatus]